VTLGRSDSTIAKPGPGDPDSGALNNISGAQLQQINRILGRNFVTKYGTKQGILVLGRVAPFGIGAGLGAAGNAAWGTA
jgi:hypothetical protein